MKTDRVLEDCRWYTIWRYVRYRKETIQMEVLLVKEKETPGTWRFKENKEDHPMTIYLTKEQVKELGRPESIRVTITAV